MRLLVAYGSKGKYFHLKEFCDTLSKFNVECKLVKDTDYSRGFPSKNIKDWFFGKRKFRDLIKEFSPDGIFIDRQTQFGVDVIKADIPLFVLLRGHYWLEQYWGKKTLYKGPLIRTVIWFRNRISEQCFSGAAIIFPICKYLEDVVKEHYPDKPTSVFFEGIDASRWYHTNEMKLEHPCVGLLQDANWWGKTKEMLTLEKVLASMPEVNFYWAGDGLYREKVLSVLGKYENFHWLGRLEYPDKVRDYLSEIDVYALVSGMDLAPLTLKEAQLMEKPVIATDSGGIPEMMQNKISGFLVKEEDYKDWIDKISLLLSDTNLAKKMGVAGRNFVKETFSWETITKKFLSAVKPFLKTC